MTYCEKCGKKENNKEVEKATSVRDLYALTNKLHSEAWKVYKVIEAHYKKVDQNPSIMEAGNEIYDAFLKIETGSMKLSRLK